MFKSIIAVFVKILYFIVECESQLMERGYNSDGQNII